MRSFISLLLVLLITLLGCNSSYDCSNKQNNQPTTDNKTNTDNQTTDNKTEPDNKTAPYFAKYVTVLPQGVIYSVNGVEKMISDHKSKASGYGQRVAFYNSDIYFLTDSKIYKNKVALDLGISDIVYRSILVTSDGTVYIGGTYRYSNYNSRVVLLKYDGSSVTATEYNDPILYTYYEIRSMAIDSNDNVYICGYHNGQNPNISYLLKYDGNNLHEITLPASMNRFEINSIVVDRFDNILIGGRDSGYKNVLKKYDGVDFTDLDLNSLPERFDEVYSLYISEDNIYVIYNSQNANPFPSFVLEYDSLGNLQNRYEVFLNSQDTYISSITQHNGEIWIAGYYGLWTATPFIKKLNEDYYLDISHINDAGKIAIANLASDGENIYICGTRDRAAFLLKTDGYEVSELINPKGPMTPVINDAELSADNNTLYILGAVDEQPAFLIYDNSTNQLTQIPLNLQGTYLKGEVLSSVINGNDLYFTGYYKSKDGDGVFLFKYDGTTLTSIDLNTIVNEITVRLGYSTYYTDTKASTLIVDGDNVYIGVNGYYYSFSVLLKYDGTTLTETNIMNVLPKGMMDSTILYAFNYKGTHYTAGYYKENSAINAYLLKTVGNVTTSIDLNIPSRLKGAINSRVSAVYEDNETIYVGGSYDNGTTTLPFLFGIEGSKIEQYDLPLSSSFNAAELTHVTGSPDGMIYALGNTADPLQRFARRYLIWEDGVLKTTKNKIVLVQEQ